MTIARLLVIGRMQYFIVYTCCNDYFTKEETTRICRARRFSSSKEIRLVESMMSDIKNINKFKVIIIDTDKSQFINAIYPNDIMDPDSAKLRVEESKNHTDHVNENISFILTDLIEPVKFTIIDVAGVKSVKKYKNSYIGNDAIIYVYQSNDSLKILYEIVDEIEKQIHKSGEVVPMKILVGLTDNIENSSHYLKQCDNMLDWYTLSLKFHMHHRILDLSQTHQVKQIFEFIGTYLLLVKPTELPIRDENVQLSKCSWLCGLY